MNLKESVFKTVRERPEPDGIDMEEFYKITIQEIEKRIDEIKDEAIKHEGIISVTDPNNSKWQLGYCKGVLLMKNYLKEMLK